MTPGAEGAILDLYPDGRDEMVVWLRTPEGPRCVRERFHPVFFVHARRGGVGALRDLGRDLAPLASVGPVGVVPRRLGLDDHPTPVLRVPVTDHGRFHHLVRLVDGRGDHWDLDLYNVDLRMSHRWFLHRGLFPFARVAWHGPGRWELRDEAWRTDAPEPHLDILRLSVEAEAPPGRVPARDDPVARVQVGDATLEGDEVRLLREVAERVAEQDPDLLLTRGGDGWDLPYLHHRAAHRDLPGWTLNRQDGSEEGGFFVGRRAKSYHSYGRILYQPRSIRLRGRVHLDAASSFFYGEAGLHGLVDLCRITSVPLAELARLGAGTAMSAIQIDRATREGRLVPWKKNRPEAWKSALTLLRADRGGYQFEPRVGLHEDVVELDFASLYPYLMETRNLSPETLECTCCDPSDPGFPTSRMVPQLPYHACARRRGFIPRVLEPVLARRAHFKRRRREDPERFQVHQEKVDALKWLLVVSFGYQGYKNARFGRIEVHESICAWGREVLLTAGEVARDHGFEVLHGLVDSLWLRREVPGADAGALAEAVERELGIPLELEGRYGWIVFLPTRSHNHDPASPRVGALNRYYGCFDAPPDHPTRSQAGQDEDYLAGGALKVRGVELRQSSASPLEVAVQEDVLRTLARAEDAAGFRALLPEALATVRPHLARLDEGRLPLEDLLVTTRVSKPLEGYRVMNHSHAALRQLAAEGVEVPPGDKVRYVVTDAGSRDPHDRVREARLLLGDETPDAAWYRTQVLRAVASLLLPFGWTENRLDAHLRPGRQRDLGAWGVA